MMMPKYSFPTNPDPEIGLMPVEGIAGIIAILNGTGRARYDILKELNASPEQQKEMRQLTAAISLIGIMTGLAIAALANIAYFVYLKAVI